MLITKVYTIIQCGVSSVENNEMLVLTDFKIEKKIIRYKKKVE